MILKIIAFFLTISSVAGFFHYGNLYYILLAIVFFLCVFRIKYHIKFGISIILFFLIACAASLILNDIPSYFNATNRFLVYTLVLIVVSPLVTNIYIGRIRLNLFFYSLVVLSFLSIGSFFAYFLGINLFVRKGNVLEIGVGTFSGLMNHSMVLGPFSAISAIYLLCLFLSVSKKTQRLILIFGFIFCVGACFFAASRIALAAALAGCIVVLMRYYKGRMSKVFMIVLLVIAVAAASFPIWGGVTEFVIAKQNRNEEMGGVIYSRERKIAARTLEFKSSPLFGIGFCTVDPRYDVVQYENGQIEPGTSWLAIASMTGLLGLLTFIIVCIVAFRQAVNIHDKILSCMFTGILVFYLIHLMAEGYIMAPRSYLNMFFWLLLGAINAEYMYSNQKTIL